MRPLLQNQARDSREFVQRDVPSVNQQESGGTVISDKSRRSDKGTDCQAM